MDSSESKLEAARAALTTSREKVKVKVETLKVLSGVPEQRTSIEAKFAWIHEQLDATGATLIVTPQEYFGGLQQQLFGDDGEEVAYRVDEIVGRIEDLSSQYDCAIAVGALVDDEVLHERRERLFIIEKGKLLGSFDKTHLPAYDHVALRHRGSIGVTPELDLDNRARVVTLASGMRITVLFCWEVYSNYVWHALTTAQPDVVLSVIKFGVRGWPKKDGAAVKGFGFGDDGGWIERLRMGCKYDVAVPIIFSTNSWKLPRRAWPLAGIMFPWQRGDDSGHMESFWHPQKGERGEMGEHMILDDLDWQYWKYVKKNKYEMVEEYGDWPDSSARKLTMMWKIKRMEQKLEL